MLAALGVAVLPSLLPYAVEYTPGDPTVVHQDKICIALKDAWHADRQPPSASDLLAVQQHLFSSWPPAYGTQAQRAAWAAQERQWERQPAVQRVDAYAAWSVGPGACVPRGRHRLILSGIGLASTVGIALVLAAIGRRRRTRLAPSHEAAPPSDRDAVLVT
ncbi:MAG TPA: hypothetical protein VGO03_06300 [Acidimicrobiia bacterium]|jgi:hypothetical protein